MTAAIRTAGMTKRFDSLTAVDGVDLEVQRGEMFGLIGPDGAGKTTTIRLLTGVLTPAAGDAEVLGFDLVREVRQVKQRVGYLSQVFSLYGDLSIDENIEFFAQIHNVRDFRTRRDELLQFTRLAPFRDRLADRLSGGMKQKLALACTLIHKPELIFLDEPTTGVDPVSRRDFWLILADLLRSGITIVMTSPYLDEAERCHRVALMHKGRLLRVDRPETIASELEGTMLEITTPAPHEAFRMLKESDEWSGAQMFGNRIHVLVDSDENEREPLRAAFEHKNIPLDDIQRTSPTLEDAFIELVRSADASNHGG